MPMEMPRRRDRFPRAAPIVGSPVNSIASPVGDVGMPVRGTARLAVATTRATVSALDACGILVAKSGKASAADRHCGHPSRHTSELVATRPSSIHWANLSPPAGPYCPPLLGRTYQAASGSSVNNGYLDGAARTDVAAACGADVSFLPWPFAPVTGTPTPT